MSEECKADTKVPGEIGWSELITTDKDAAIEFYTSLNGWTTVEMALPNDLTYTIFKNGDADIGGCLALPEGETAPPMWLNYIKTADLDQSTKKVLEIGGTVIKERVDIPMGSFIILSDPQGAVIALWECKS
ncbi:MAG: VOC family protein [Bacteroidota bacterium]